MAAGERVNLIEGQTPSDYHCDCPYCKMVIGELRPEGGAYYSRLERRQYYDRGEQGPKGHIAKTPLHVARWLIQRYTEHGDWVLDPTIGAGTTAVEAITQGRNVAGMELQFKDVLYANVSRALQGRDAEAKIQIGDARNIREFLDKSGEMFKLVVSNPPYSGDEGDPGPGYKENYLQYKDGLPNLAFLKEGQPYWDALRKIYEACIDYLEPGGHFGIGVKDMMRNKKPFLLHLDLCNLLADLGLEAVGTAFLKHYPPTLHLSTYEKRYGVPCPTYQTISVFRKKEE